MSVDNELKQRFNLQEGDWVTFVRDLYQCYAASRILPSLLLKCHMDSNIIVKRQDGKMGMYTENGETVIPEDNHKCWPEFYYDDDYHCEVICIQKNGLIEVRSYDGKKQIVPKTQGKVNLRAWGIKVSRNGWDSWIAYSYEGKQIFLQEVCSEETVRDTNGDYIAFICDNKECLFGVYSTEGTEIIPFGNHWIKYRKPFFEVINKKSRKVELYSLSGQKLPFDEADKFEWNDNGIFCTDVNLYYDSNMFIMAYKDGKRSALYTYEGTKVIPEPEKYAKMYLEKEYIICIGHDGITMDVYNFDGNKIIEYKP